MKWKRALSFLIVCCMMLAMIPSAVFAAGNTYEISLMPGSGQAEFPDTAVEGETVTINVNVPVGYSIDDITLIVETESEVRISTEQSAPGSNTFYFTMPDDDVYISISWGSGTSGDSYLIECATSPVIDFSTNVSEACESDEVIITVNSIADGYTLGGFTVSYLDPAPGPWSSYTQSATRIDDTHYSFYMFDGDVNVSADLVSDSGVYHIVNNTGLDSSDLWFTVGGVRSSSADAGQKVTVCYQDYVVFDLHVTGADDTEIELVESPASTYFIMPAQDVTVTAEVYHDVRVASFIDNGTVYAELNGREAEVAKAGQTITVYPSASEDYVTGAVFYSDINGLTQVSLGANGYTFMMPDGPVTISAVFMPYLSLGENTIECMDDITIGSYFTPATSGLYRFASEGEVDDSIVIYDGDDVIASGDNENGINYDCSVFLRTGKSYRVSFASEFSAPFEDYGQSTLTISKVPLSFKGVSLTLQNDLKMNFSVSRAYFAENGYSDPYVTFEMNGKTVTVDEPSSVTAEAYIFSFSNISPDRMGDTITATLYATLGTEVESVETGYSVSDYCYALLGRTTDSMLRTLVVDLLHYGTCASAYTGKGSAVDTALTAEQLAWGTQGNRALTSVANRSSSTIESPRASFTGAMLNLKDSVTMQFVFTVTSPEEGDVVLVLVRDGNGKVIKVVQPADLVRQGSNYIVKFEDLTAAQMSDTIYLTIYNMGTVISDTLSYSIESYAYAKQNDSDTALAALVKAMMNYGDSAKAFAEAQA